MSTQDWTLIAVGAVIVIAVVGVAAGLMSSRKRTNQLEQPKDLAVREREPDTLHIVALKPTALAHFRNRWHQVQTAFVDDPAAALGAADRLVIDVMREKGYPIGHFEQRADDISVEHPEIVEHYRCAHRIRLAQMDGAVSTEMQREAFVHYRALFKRLLKPTDNDTSQEAKA
ncbi:hypothetical protein A5662_02660 [Mycobacteriaceae bacterium 1482268.1]|nr:hypothetical protein A5662_02660 [Mycobacteriaceae bacterium 1482268.1]